jgi:replicative DNA helicase
MAQSIDDARRRHQGASGARVPPHNLQAEESLLGAMLLSRDAIVSAVEVQLSAEDFYKPAHGHIYDAITTLYAQGDPADPVTVAESLRRAGVLDAIGGPGILVSLQAGTPAIGNAGRYARIIEEHSLLRRLIRVAGDIAEIGYGLPDDVANAVDEAEAMVFDVAQRRVTDSMATIRDLLSAQLDHLEALYERNQEITGVPTGFIDLDRQLAGLQPSNLVIIGGRPGTGKALALTTPIPTPTGWTTMGELEVGHQVLDATGRPASVTYATPVMLGRPCYEVLFDDGSRLVADADHQWFVHRDAGHRSLRRVVTTRQMIDEGVRLHRDGRPNWFVPVTKPLDLPAADLPVEPYDIGRRLAGGGPAEASGHSGCQQLLTRRLVATRIPEAYLRASTPQRLDLLRGLLDAAGQATAGGVEMSSADLPLLRQVRELVCSLGYRPGPIRARTVRLAGGQVQRAWRLWWRPVTVGRPGRRAVSAIRPVPSVPVRCITVDSPDHLYLAGESMIPTHNTSFALGVAANAALEARTPVLIFSLEMSHRELTQRLLCSEARVDATRMRNGKLLESDWPKISHAVGRLGEAPLFIDDNPHLTVMEIRAKARRLKSREGLGLIVIDYMQLMSGRSNAENRQVEISEMSRGLKILARELNVPVIALSQLSRNLESRADKRPILSDLRESGCMPAGTRLLRADNGEDVSLGDLVLSQERPLVWSVDEHQRLVPAQLVNAFPSGVKPVFKLRLASGRSVDATANHPFLTVEGWTRLDALQRGSLVAVPRRLAAPLHPADSWNDDELALLAHLIGGGSMGPRFTYTTADPANRQVVEDAARRLFAIEAEATKAHGTWSVRFPSPYPITSNAFHPMRNWLEPHGLWRSRASTRFIPPSIFGLGDDKVALFLRHLWTTDGSITIGSDGGGRVVTPSYATTSHRLALDVQRLLLRLGIPSTVGRSKKGSLEAFSVRALDVPDEPSDLLWDEVVEIVALGMQPTFDATVAGTHNFIADGVVAHNSLEQDADVVIFLYRDEVYNRDTADRGTAEVIVAKHRNGPIGVTHLAFLDHYTRFANMARV